MLFVAVLQYTVVAGDTEEEGGNLQLHFEKLQLPAPPTFLTHDASAVLHSPNEPAALAQYDDSAINIVPVIITVAVIITVLVFIADIHCL